jgi:hypothetical protein
VVGELGHVAARGRVGRVQPAHQIQKDTWMSSLLNWQDRHVPAACLTQGAVQDSDMVMSGMQAGRMLEKRFVTPVKPTCEHSSVGAH